MKAALKALSSPEFDIKEHYDIDRMIHNVAHPAMKHLHKTRDYTINANGGELLMRSFLPKVSRSKEIILYFHGGGWVSGSVDSYTQTCAMLSNQTGRQVLALEYRLAPEYPFPTAINDCYEASRELYTSDNRAGEDIILMGDSAGGNLAAAVSLMAADRREFHVCRQILIYPATYNDHTNNSPFPSVTENGEDYLLTSKRIQDYMELYDPGSKNRDNPYLAPYLSNNLWEQPDTLIITAEYDPLRDEGEAYGEKLRQFDNRVTVVRTRDALHGFFMLPMRFAQLKRCYCIINDFLDGERPEKLTI